MNNQINELHGKGSLGSLKDYHKAAEKVSTDNPDAQSYHHSSTRRAEHLSNVVKAKKDIDKSKKHSTLEKGWRKLISAKDSAKQTGEYAKSSRNRMKKDDERIHNVYLKAKGIRKEETKMDNKQQIFEAIDNILENNLNEMKENLSKVLQEKTAEKLEEKKKDIAANYFAQ